MIWDGCNKVVTQNHANVVSSGAISGILSTLKVQHEQRAGKGNLPIGEIEFLRAEAIGTSYIRFTYVEKLIESGVLWRIYFYRGKSEWNVCGLTCKNGPDEQLWTALPQ